MLWKQQGFLTPSGDKIKNGPYAQSLLDTILLPAALAIIKGPGHCKSDSLEARGNHLTDTSLLISSLYSCSSSLMRLETVAGNKNTENAASKNIFISYVQKEYL